MHRLLIVAMGALCLSSSAAHAYQFGDLDGDGKIGIADSITSLQISAGLSPLIAVPTVRTIVVSPDPADATVGGDRLLAAIAELPQASANDQWLIKLEPGRYDLGTAGCLLPAYVHLEGSGMGVTTIRSLATNTLELLGTSQARQLTVERGRGTAENAAGVLVKDAYTLLQDVTVTGESSNTVTGIQASSVVKLTLRNVHIDVKGDTQSFGLVLATSDADLFDLEIQAHGARNNWGILISAPASSQKMTLRNGSIHVWDGTYPNDGMQMGIATGAGKLSVSDSEILAEFGNSTCGLSTGYSSSGGEVRVRNSVLVAQWAASFNYGLNNSGSTTTHVQSSRLSAISSSGSNLGLNNASTGGHLFVDGTDIGGLVRNQSTTRKIWVSSSKFRSGTGSVSGSVTCAGVWDQAYSFYASACP